MDPQAVPDDVAAASSASAQAVRHFGRFQLLQLLGKSQRTMAWHAMDPRVDQDLVLVMPRHQPASASALRDWTSAVRKAARLNHPNLAAVVESGVVDGWPFAAYDPRDAATLSERLTPKGQSGTEVAAWAVQGLEGLAFAHDAGVAHHDVQPFLVLLTDSGQLRLMGTEVALDDEQATQGKGGRGDTALDAQSLAAQRRAAERDVLCFGLLMHQALSGTPPLDEPDLGRAADSLPPIGRDICRLPWTTAQPIADPLRAIVNRATDRQERQRYRNPRTLVRALQGWLKTDAESGGGPLALLLDRLHSVGLLPASPGITERAARMALMERERTNELAEVVLEDLAMSFEMLRMVNTAQVRGAQVAGTGPVLTVRRAIAMLGLDGVRRAALGLRRWPGPLSQAQAPALKLAFQRARRAGMVARAIRPAGYDGEVVFLVTLLQNLGRLAVEYHFPEDAQQIRRLMLPAPSPREGEPDEPGMTEANAALAVLGTDIESLGVAVARHWGLDATVLHMVRRLSLDAPVRAADTDDDLLRAVASCANEVVDASTLPGAQLLAALNRIAQRYARVLSVGLKDLQVALNPAKAAASEPADTPARRTA